MDYRTAGVDVEQGDRASGLALEHARRTFGFRAGRVGTALQIDGVFTGLIDVGPFYLAMNSDGVGSKALVARGMGNLRTLGYDLLAMVADDAACAGAEPMALVNTLDVEKVTPTQVDELMQGLEEACAEASVSVVGGEIAEMCDQVRGFSWSAALVGLLRKDRVLGPQNVVPGQTVLGLLTDNFRSNGYTLLRRVLERQFGDGWVSQPFGASTWGEVALAPSQLFSPFLMQLTGGFSGEPLAPIAAAAHITGGGLEHNVGRVIPRGCRVVWGAPPPPPPSMAFLVQQGWVAAEEARKAWNMGVGMAVITSSPSLVLEFAAKMQVPAVELGKVAAI